MTKDVVTVEKKTKKDKEELKTNIGEVIVPISQRSGIPHALAVCVGFCILLFSLYSPTTSAQQCCGETFDLGFSTSADRSGSVALGGATVSGDIYVFLRPINPLSGINKVKWYIDTPSTQQFLLFADNSAPYDFVQGSDVLALPLDTTTLTDGEHTIIGKIVYQGSPIVREDIVATFTVDNAGPPPVSDSFEFGLAEAANRLEAEAELTPDPEGVLAVLFGEIFVFIGESATCTLASCVPVEDPQIPPPPAILDVTFTFDIGTPDELVVNTDTLAPFDLGAMGNTLDNPGFNFDNLAEGPHTLTATMTRVDGEAPIVLTRSFIAQPLIAALPGSLQGVPVLEDPQLAPGAGIVLDDDWSRFLGRSFFWDLQTGGDGRQACATCHYHAGVDNRILNTVNPMDGLYDVDSGGPGGTLTSDDFNFHQFADPLDRGSAIVRSINDVVGSQGQLELDHAGINVGSDQDSFTNPAVLNPDFVDGDGMQRRQVTGRNTPTNINAVFNMRNFWDGRANFIFNGRTPFGARDTGAVVYEDNDGPGGSGPVGVQLRLRFSALASQAVGPPNNSVEMAYNGRTFPELGRKLLSLQPLAKQTIAIDDSMFGTPGPFGCQIAGQPMGGACASDGMGLGLSYADLIMLAFDPKYWDGDPVTIDGEVYTLMEANFSMFWGLALQKWQSILVSDQSKWDRFRAGTPAEQQAKVDLALALAAAGTEPDAANSAPFDPADILTNAETRGMESFLGGECIACHAGPVLSAATIPFLLGPPTPNEPPEQVVERMLMAQGQAALEIGLFPPSAMYDLGFYNIGIRPTDEDIGIGGNDDFGNPLSFAEQLQSGNIVDEELDTPAAAGPEPDLLFVDPNTFERSPGVSPIGAPVAVNGAFKVPTLRNIFETAPYMHNGGHISLVDVVAFYARGADFGEENIADLDPEVGGIGNLRGNPQGVADLVTFMGTFTDLRVREEADVFDHPSILLENGINVPAVGIGGNGAGTALPTFDDRLNGPTARADLYMIDVDEVLSDNILDNDSDGDGSGTVEDPLLIPTEGPTTGTLNVLNNDGTFTYTPAAGFRGVDSFAYDAATTDPTDPRSNVARVTIEIGGAVPVANADMYMTELDTPLNVAAPGVLGNDLDPDSPVLTAALVSGPMNASAFMLNPDGSFDYTPTLGFEGQDSFMYTANDESGPSAPATVTIDVMNAQAPCPNDGVARLCYSTSADRSNPLLLEGATVTGTIYVFMTPVFPGPTVTRVKWYLDTPSTQQFLLGRDNDAPFDFIEGTVAAGDPFDTSTVSLGSHTMIGKIVFNSPFSRVDVPATFTVE